MDHCEGCLWTDYTRTGSGWKPVRSPVFGDRCYSKEQVAAKMREADGHWPGTPDFDMAAFAAVTSLNGLSDRGCVSLPEGTPCYLSIKTTSEGLQVGQGGPTCMEPPSPPPAGPPTACAADCKWFDPSAHGLSFMEANPMFGSRCHTMSEALAQMHGGHWPGIPDYTAGALPLSLRNDPRNCFSLPEGLPCSRKTNEGYEPCQPV